MSHALTIHDLAAGNISSLLLAYVRRLSPRWLHAEHEDLAQQALVRVSAAYQRDPSRTLNKSYLHQVARSVVLDHMRKFREHRVIADDAAVETARACRTTNPELIAANTEMIRFVERAVATLLADRAAAVRLYLAGHSVPDIARRMRTSPKRAENLTYRGLKDLRATLTAQGLAPCA